MNILVIGGGGREHALVWKLRQSAQVEHIWCAPGNCGIARHAECVAADTKDVAALVALGERLKPDLTVVGPELPLVSGIADEFAARGLRLVGPSKQAARLEGSKAFAKEFLLRHGIPTGKLYGIYDSAADAKSALRAVDWPCVIKADGLAAGKGVLVAASPDEAAAFIDRLMVAREFGAGGERAVIEETLAGPELSYIILADGERIAPLAACRDHKRIFDGNKGPNTGGMGAYAADGLLGPALEDRILSTIVRPTMAALEKENLPYRGFLYFGLMLTQEGPKVLEFNCRMGDPETQALVVRMDFDLAAVLLATAEGRLDPSVVRWKPGAGVTVVMAAAGYPGEPRLGARIDGLAGAELVPGVVVFHAGTRLQENACVVSGGRVLGVTASGPNLPAAAGLCYDGVAQIRFAGAQFRKDIGAHDSIGGGATATGTRS